jgi:hypothetical protein
LWQIFPKAYKLGISSTILISEVIMRLTPPTKIVFWISVVLAVLGILGKFAGVAVLAPYAFWLVLIAYVLLFLGNAVKGF